MDLVVLKKNGCKLFVYDVHVITQRAYPRKKVKRERQMMKAR